MHCSTATALFAFAFSLALSVNAHSGPAAIDEKHPAVVAATTPRTIIDGASHAHPQLEQDKGMGYDTGNDGYDTEDEDIGYPFAPNGLVPAVQPGPGGPPPQVGTGPGQFGGMQGNQGGFVPVPSSKPTVIPVAPSSSAAASPMPGAVQPIGGGTGVFYGDANGRNGERAAGFVIMMFMGGVAVFGMI